MLDHFRSRNNTLSDEAISWVVRMAGHPTPAERAAFEQWCGRSPAHAASVRHAQALLDDIGRTEVADEHRRWVQALSPAPRRRISRRAFLAGGVSAAAVAGLAASGLLLPPASLFADQRTRTGERRQFALPDGSQAWLNTASALSVAFSATRRHVSVASGEVLFDVVADAGRPFVAQCRDGEILIGSGRCSLRRESRRSTLTVLEGSAEVHNAAGKATLAANQCMAFSADVLGLVEAVDAEALTAWIRGKLIFNRQPLATIAAELERYVADRVVVLGDGLRRMQLSGVFDLEDPDALLRTVAALADARIVRLPLMTLIR
ncbi:FecR family protein [Stenotrophomonas tumulicola]|uniref:FecR domain-containing protein n=1 Tax=Stenotrophomonas tumulicola TaxID=1685415 RepID=A0A7W3FNU5_9GAMM|nr:FecR domain-containing protein [Stenotrophomonas tumulicola]MBA8682617.1 FecR domain-containing protein [Stenotrophomonas tumulicola]